jgi:hypothetical protein
MVTLAVGEPYQESGAKAFDNVDKWLEKISVSGTIDTAKSGVYTLAYAAADKAGNIATKLRTVQVIPPLFKRFNVPSPQPLESIDTTFTKIKVEGWGPDLSSIINLKVMWKLDQQKLDTFDFHLNIMTGKGKKAHPATLGAKLTHTFGQKEPALTLKETGIHGFDGEYYARKSENGLILVRIDGNCAILCNP